MRLGVDLGGSKIEIIALADDGRELLRRRVATPQGDYKATLLAVAGLVEEAEGELGERGSLGIGIPGAESLATGRIKNANSTCLIGQPLRRDLQTILQREVRLANDANCFALSEASDGAAAGAGVVFGVILGTGVGGGIVVDGKLIAGANRIAGEWGHNPLPLPTGDDLPLPACYCGRAGCIEAYLSGPAASAELARQGGGETAEASLAAALSFAQIVAAADAGDARAEAALCRYEGRLARALAGVINLLDPDVIVLGGGVSNVERLYANVPRLWGEFVFSDEVRTRFVKNRHGDSSGVRGAAWLWNG